MISWQSGPCVADAELEELLGAETVMLLQE
jgi:hypothetical protein